MHVVEPFGRHGETAVPPGLAWPAQTLGHDHLGDRGMRVQVAGMGGWGTTADGSFCHDQVVDEEARDHVVELDSLDPVSRDQVVEALGRDQVVDAAGPDQVVEPTRRDQVVEATARDQVVEAAGAFMAIPRRRGELPRWAPEYGVAGASRVFMGSSPLRCRRGGRRRAAMGEYAC
jgi:hypothetical protein